MSADTVKPLRQWISLPGTSCDVRVGHGVIDSMGTILKGSIGRPQKCALVYASTAPEDVVERVRRQLLDAGFKVNDCVMVDGPEARTMRRAVELAEYLGERGITSDDLVCAVGGLDLLSLVSYVSSSWCGGTQACHVPLDLAGCIESATTPRGIDVGALREGVATRPAAKHQFCDISFVDIDPETPASLYARAIMASTAIVEAENAFGRLWDRAELVAVGDVETLCAQIADSSKSRGRLVSSTSIAVRQCITYGVTFMRALRGLVPMDVADGLLIAEGMRFQARLSCGMEQLKVDDVLTIDELLDMLELPPIACDVDPEEMVAALKAERFSRSNRFLLELPRAIGRVRPGTVEDDLLQEHAQAWCAARATE